MAPDDETKSHAVEAHDNAENIKTGKEPEVENLTEKTEEQKVHEKKEIAETVAEIIERNLDEAVVEKEPVASVVEKKQEEPNVIDESKEKGRIVVDENTEAEIKEKSKDECVKETFVPLKIEDPATDVENDDEVSTDDGKQDTMENVGTITKATEDEKSAVENVKTESKEEKAVDETKEDKTSPKQSVTLIGRVKKSFMKAKKVITFTGKNNTNTKTPQTKEDDKA